ncbi:MAG TPA: FliH/SctL family protein [Gammaproteobacteria bacterium]|nr:FliH/SctL family protein [Gammaproteobacteria bacterium]
MSRSRIIGAEQAVGAASFDFPAVDQSAADALRGAAKGSAHMLTAGQVDVLQRQAQEEARQRGFEEGLAAGKAEFASRVARLTALGAAFAQPFQTLEESVEEEIVALAVQLACHLVRREIERDPAVLQAAVHDGLAALAPSVRDVTLYLHPDDAALFRSHAPAQTDFKFKLATDASLARGDLRIASATSLVDGSLAARCAEILAAVRLGGHAEVAST